MKWTTRISRQQLYTGNFTLSDWSLCTWSWIRDLRGEITKVTPAPISPVSWKHRLFPPPVGIKIKQSNFIIAALMASSWFVLNERMLYTFFNIFHISLWYGKSFRFSSTAKGRENNKPRNRGPQAKVYMQVESTDFWHKRCEGLWYVIRSVMQKT